MIDYKYVTYYLGAGASANSLPCVNQLPERIEKIIDFCKNTALPSGESEELKSIKQSLINDLQELNKNSKKFATIDTYAKYLYLTTELEEYKKLRYLLAYFFIVEQMSHEIDNRYDTFFANILNHADSFPPNIRIFSWNYDSQVEISFNKFRKNKDLFVGLKQDELPQIYEIFHLNGVASFKKLEVKELRKETIANESKFTDENKIKENRLLHLIQLYKEYVKRPLEEQSYSEDTCDLLFAFDERKGIAPRVSERIKEIITKTDALVIIGYTFPFFNRKVDRELLSNLKDTARIYIQDRDEKGSRNVKQNLIATLNNDSFDKNIILLDSAEQFYLPPEL